MFRLARTSLALLLALAAPSLAGTGEAESGKTLAPYFFVEGGDPAVDRFPLESTHVDVVVSGVIADVGVTQVYANDGRRPINARYVFPAGTRAAVNGLRMTVGDQVIEAQIQERKHAQKTFDAAKQAGKTATLLEQERPNVFSMSVANVMPGDRIEVTLRYTELLVPTEGEYEFVFPTVVGPRYSNLPAGSSGSEWLATPYLREGAPPPARLTISGAVSAGLPIRAIASRTHAIEGKLEAEDRYRFALAAGEEHSANRDFVLAYRLAGDAIQSGLSLYDAGAEKFFLLLVEPPARVAADLMPPREIVFVLDVSGSMHGFPLDTAKGLLRRLTATLRPIDKFNVLLFSGGSRLMAPQSLPATRENIALALSTIEREDGGGGTELLPALQRALSLSKEAGLSRSILVITDGYIGADREVVQHVASHLGEANLFAFGIGSSVNRYLIEGLAHAGQGEPFVVTQEGEAEAVAQRFATYVDAPALTDVRVAFEGFDAYALEPRSIPDVLAARPVVVVGKWRGEPRGRVRVTGASGAGAFSQLFDVAAVPARAENRALPFLWARSRIAALSDYGLAEPSEAAQGEILALGLRYSLLTRYTSFVAVSHVVRNREGAATDVKQPLPLPQGVSGLAVGAEPELTLVLLLAALAAGLRWRARARLAAARA